MVLLQVMSATGCFLAKCIRSYGENKYFTLNIHIFRKLLRKTLTKFRVNFNIVPLNSLKSTKILVNFTNYNFLKWNFFRLVWWWVKWKHNGCHQAYSVLSTQKSRYYLIITSPHQPTKPDIQWEGKQIFVFLFSCWKCLKMHSH